MSISEWNRNKEKREASALESHARLSRLFREDRLAFERERKRLIDEVIDQARDEEQKKRLIALQESWNKKMRRAGSEHNRFVLAQTFFWEHFHERWVPAIEGLNQILNAKSK
jgi:hypothetical protein